MEFMKYSTVGVILVPFVLVEIELTFKFMLDKATYCHTVDAVSNQMKKHRIDSESK